MSTDARIAPTLADMTPEERQSCVGMWCENLASSAKEPALVVLSGVQGGLCWVLHADLHGERSCFPLDRVAPRPDLMRAWNPDGEPVPGSAFRHVPDRAVMRQEIIADLIDNLKESL